MVNGQNQERRLNQAIMFLLQVGLLKPPPFKILKIGDPDQLLQDQTKYIKQFKRFLSVTKADGGHSDGHINCGGCSISKNMLLMKGHEKLESLWDHVGRVCENDSFKTTLKKVEDGIKKQTNQAVSRHKLFTKLPQEEKVFSVW